MTKEKVWYFAYGSNLNMGQMITRVGEWKTSVKAILRGYKLVFNVESRRWGGMAANIIKTDKHEDKVYGAIYLILKEKIDVLTVYENIKPEPVMAEAKGKQMRAQAYIFSPKRPSSKPPEAYLNTMIEGLRQHGYEEEVIRKMKGIAENF